MTKERPGQDNRIQFPDNRTFAEKRRQERFNALYDTIQELLWQYPEFKPKEFGEIVQGAAREHYDNYGNPGDSQSPSDWDLFLNGVTPLDEPGET